MLEIIDFFKVLFIHFILSVFLLLSLFFAFILKPWKIFLKDYIQTGNTKF